MKAVKPVAKKKTPHTPKKKVTPKKASTPKTEEPQMITGLRPYIGCKIIQAKPMTNREFVLQTNKEKFDESMNLADGYLVIYPDGYASWSPRQVFDQAYRGVLQAEADLIIGREDKPKN